MREKKQFLYDNLGALIISRTDQQLERNFAGKKLAFASAQFSLRINCCYSMYFGVFLGFRKNKQNHVM